MQSPFKRIVIILCYFFAVQFLLVGCRSKKKVDNLTYFQHSFDTTIEKIKYQEYKFRIDDVIAIQVIAGSQRQEDATLYNIPSVGGTRSGQASAYQIDSLGFISFPRIGRVKAESLTKDELAASITKQLSDEVKNPLVIVNLDRFKISVLGEVRKPGVIVLHTDKVNIIDAITEAGDLSDYGKKDEVMLLRKLDGKYQTYKIDLTKVAFMNSPVFQVFPDDIIYVGPNVKKNKMYDERSNYLRDLSIFISSISSLVYLFTLVGLIKR